jgi:hypothetical protein
MERMRGYFLEKGSERGPEHRDPTKFPQKTKEGSNAASDSAILNSFCSRGLKKDCTYISAPSPIQMNEHAKQAKN